MLWVASLVWLLGCGGSSSALHECPPTAAPPTPLPERAEVVVVGAGLTGLVAAYRLSSQGVDVIAVDAAARPGGRVQTVQWADGLHGEAHMEEYWESSPAYPLLRELGLPLEEDVAHSSVRLEGQIFPYRWPFGDDEVPTREQVRDAYFGSLFSPAEREALLGWMERAWTLYEQLEATGLRGEPLPEELDRLTHVSFADWVLSEELPPRVAEWIRVTVEPEMAIEWDRVAALDGIDEMRLFLDRATGFGERNFHVRGGNNALIEALVDRIGRSRLFTRARVTAVAQDESGVSVRVLREGSRFHTVRADQVLLTMPVWDLANVQLDPPLDEARRRAIETTRAASYVKVLIRARPAACALTLVELEGEPVDTLTLLSDSGAGSIYEASSEQRPCSAAGDQPRLFTLLLHARFAREVMGLPHEAIRARAYDSMDALFPGISAHFMDAEVFTYPRAVAYWPIDEGRSRFDALAQLLRRSHGRVWIGGDTTENAHSEGAFQAAERMAREVLRARSTELRSSPGSHGLSMRASRSGR